MKSTKIIVGIIVVLAAVVGVTAWLNQGGLEERRRSQEGAILFLKQGDQTVEVTFEDIRALPEQEFDAVLRGSGRLPVDVRFTGVELKRIIEGAGLDPAAINQVVTRAADGYSVSLSGDEVRMDDNVYIVFEQDGNDLGTREDGGTGPYRLVIRQDEFAQRWNKYLMEIELQ